jgi:hypothetical protein
MGAPGAWCPPWTPAYSARPPIAPDAWYNHLGVRPGVLGARLAGLSSVKFRLFKHVFGFWAFLGKGSSEFKNAIKICLQKSPCRKLFPKKSGKKSVSVFPRLLLVYRVFGCFSAMGIQKHYKKRFANKIVSKEIYKEFDQKSKI